MRFFKFILKPLFKYLEVNSLAKKNTRFHGLLNKIVNGCDIGYNVHIPKSIKIMHGVGIVIGQGSVLGKNLRIYQNVTLGIKDGKYPKIGNNVTIYPNALILGGVKIGDNSIIGAGSIVLEDVESNFTVYNKLKLIKKRN